MPIDTAHVLSFFYRQPSRQRMFWPFVHDWSQYIQTLSPDKRHLDSSAGKRTSRRTNSGALVDCQRDCRLHPMLRALSSRERGIYKIYVYV